MGIGIFLVGGQMSPKCPTELELRIKNKNNNKRNRKMLFYG